MYKVLDNIYKTIHMYKALNTMNKIIHMYKFKQYLYKFLNLDVSIFNPIKLMVFKNTGILSSRISSG